MPENENLKRFYGVLVQTKAIDGLPSNYSEFSEAMKDPKVSESLFNALSKAKSIEGFPSSYKEFQDGLGISQPPGKPAADTTGSIGGGSPLGLSPTDGTQPSTSRSGEKKGTTPASSILSSDPEVSQRAFADKQIGGFKAVGEIVTDPVRAGQRTAAFQYEQAQKFNRDVQEARRNLVNKDGTVNTSSTYSVPYGQEGQKVFMAATDPTGKAYQKAKTEAEAALKSIDPIISEKVSERITDKNFSEYLSVNVSGQEYPDETKLMDLSVKISEEMGLPESRYFRDLVKNRLTQEVQHQKYRPQVEEELKKSKDFQKLQGEKAEFGKQGAAVIENAKQQVNTLQSDLVAQQQLEIQPIDAGYKDEVTALNIQFQQGAAAIGQSAQQLTALYQSGELPYEEYAQQFQGLEQQGQQLEADYKASFDAASEQYINAVNTVNSKYNNRFQRQQREVYAMAQQKAKELFDKGDYSASDREKLRQIYENAYKTVQGREFGRAESVKQMYGARERAFSKFMSGLGGAMKGYGEALDMPSMRTFGESMENQFFMTPAQRENWSDLLNVGNLAELSGELAGGMAIPLVSSAAVATFSPGTAGKMIGGALASFYAESLDMAGRMQNEIFSKTGSAAEANEAAAKTMETQYSLMWAYSLDALPFVGKLLRGIPTAGLRIGTGAAIEYLSELTQEYPQNVFEEAIREGKDPYGEIKNKLELVFLGDGNKEEVDKARQDLKSTAITIAPVAVLGGAGQAKDVISERIEKGDIKRAAEAYAATVRIGEMTSDASDQLIFRTLNKEGKTFTTAVVGSWFINGQIDQQTRDNLLMEIDNAQAVSESAGRAGMNIGQAAIYSALNGKYRAAMERADQETDPILKEVQEQAAERIRKQLTDFASTKRANYAVTTMPDGSQLINTLEEVQGMIDDPVFAQSFRDGQIKVEIFGDVGAGQDVIDGLARLAPAQAEDVSTEEESQKSGWESEEQDILDIERAGRLGDKVRLLQQERDAKRAALGLRPLNLNNTPQEKQAIAKWNTSQLEITKEYYSNLSQVEESEPIQPEETDTQIESISGLGEGGGKIEATKPQKIKSVADIVAETKAKKDRAERQEEAKRLFAEARKRGEVERLRKESEAQEAIAAQKVARDAEVTQIESIRQDLTDQDLLMADLPESVDRAIDRMDAGIPSDPVQVNEAITALDTKFEQLEAYKSDPNRTHTTAQIDEVIDLLSEAKTELQLYQQQLQDYESTIQPRQEGQQQSEAAAPVPETSAAQTDTETVEAEVTTETRTTSQTESNEPVDYVREEDGQKDGQKVPKQPTKTIAQLESENRKTAPKIPSEKVFLNEVDPVPQDKGKELYSIIDNGNESTLPIEKVMVKDIIPTQKSLTIPNLKSVSKASVDVEPIVLLKNNGKYYIVDGHHRIANSILSGNSEIEARVYYDSQSSSQSTKNQQDAVQIEKTESILPRQQGETGKTGSEREGVGQSQQGKETARESQKEERLKESVLTKRDQYNELTPYRRGQTDGRQTLSDINRLASQLGYTVSVRPDGGIDLTNDAGKKVVRTARKETLPDPTPNEVRTAKRLIDNGVLNWDGDMFSPRADIGLPWQDIRKGLSDIEAGKTNTSPAKRVILALNKAAEKGEVDYVAGSGNIIERQAVPIESTPTETEYSDITEDAFAADIEGLTDQQLTELDNLFNDELELQQTEADTGSDTADATEPAAGTQTKTTRPDGKERVSEKEAERHQKAVASIKDKLKEAKERAAALRRSSGIDAFEKAKQKAKVDREIFDLYVDLAKEYIRVGVNTLSEFAKEAGEAVNDYMKSAWQHVKDKAPIPDEYEPSKVRKPESGEKDQKLKIGKGESAVKKRAALGLEEKGETELVQSWKDNGFTLGYEPIGQAATRKFGAAIVDAYGDVTDTQTFNEILNAQGIQFRGAVNTAVLGETIDRLDAARIKAKDPLVKQKMGLMMQKAVEVLAENLIRAGQEISQVYNVYLNSSEGIFKMNIERERREARKKTDGSTGRPKRNKEKVQEAQEGIDKAGKQAAKEASKSKSVEKAKAKAVESEATPKTPEQAKKEELDKRERAAKNKLKEAWERAKAARRSPGIDPTAGKATADRALLDAVAELGLVKIEKGYATLAQWTKQMVKELKKLGLTDSEISGVDLDSVFNQHKPVADKISLQQNAEALARRALRRALPQQPGKFDPIAQMLDTLFGKIDEKLPERAKKTPLTAFEKIRLSLSEFENYRETWESSKDEVLQMIEDLDAEVYSKEDKAALAGALYSYFEEEIGIPFSERQAEQAVKDRIKDVGLEIDKILLQANSIQDKTKDNFIQQLTDDLVIGTGISQAQAKEIAAAFEEQFNKIWKDKSLKVLNRIFPNLSGVVSKHRPEHVRIFEAIRAGAFEGGRRLSKDGSSYEYFADLFGEKFGFVNPNDPAFQKKMREFADQIASLPEGVLRDDVFDLMQDYIEFEKNKSMSFIRRMGQDALMRFYAGVLLTASVFTKTGVSNVIMKPYVMTEQILRNLLEGRFSMIPVIWKATYGTKGIPGFKISRSMIEAGAVWYGLNAMAKDGQKAGRSYAEQKAKYSRTLWSRIFGKYGVLAGRGLSALDMFSSASSAEARFADLLFDALRAEANKNAKRTGKKAPTNRELSAMVKDVLGWNPNYVENALETAQNDILKAYGTDPDTVVYTASDGTEVTFGQVKDIENTLGRTPESADIRSAFQVGYNAADTILSKYEALSAADKKTLSKRNLDVRRRVLEILDRGRSNRLQQFKNTNDWVNVLNEDVISALEKESRDIAQKIGLMGRPAGTPGAIAELIAKSSGAFPESKLFVAAFINAPVNAAEMWTHTTTVDLLVRMPIQLLRNRRGLAVRKWMEENKVRTKMYGETTSTLPFGIEVNMEKKELLLRRALLMGATLPLEIMLFTSIVEALKKGLEDDDDDQKKKVKALGLTGMPQYRRREIMFGVGNKPGAIEQIPVFVTGAMFGSDTPADYAKNAVFQKEKNVEPYTVYIYGKPAFSYLNNPVLGAVFGKVGAGNDLLLFQGSGDVPESTLGLMMISDVAQMSMAMDQSGLKGYKDVLNFVFSLTEQDPKTPLEKTVAQAEKMAGNALSNQIPFSGLMRQTQSNIKGAKGGVPRLDPKAWYEFAVVPMPILNDIVIEGRKTDHFGNPINYEFGGESPVLLDIIDFKDGAPYSPIATTISQGRGQSDYELFEKQRSQQYRGFTDRSYWTNEHGFPEKRRISQDVFKAMQKDFAEELGKELQNADRYKYLNSLSPEEFKKEIKEWANGYSKTNRGITEYIDGVKDVIIRKHLGENAYMSEKESETNN